jgi:hypothetical protein
VSEPDDTTAAARAHLDRLYRAMSPRQKIERVLALCEATRLFALAGLRRRFPGEDDRQLRLRLAELTLGPELFAAVRAHAAER